MIVCDASQRALRSGSTHPAALAGLYKRKLRLLSKPGLHAKVFVVGNAAFVGSANASANSAGLLIEAVVRSVRRHDEEVDLVDRAVLGDQLDVGSRPVGLVVRQARPHEGERLTLVRPRGRALLPKRRSRIFPSVLHRTTAEPIVGRTLSPRSAFYRSSWRGMRWAVRDGAVWPRSLSLRVMECMSPSAHASAGAGAMSPSQGLNGEGAEAERPLSGLASRRQHRPGAERAAHQPLRPSTRSDQFPTACRRGWLPHSARRPTMEFAARRPG